MCRLLRFKVKFANNNQAGQSMEGRISTFLLVLGLPSLGISGRAAGAADLPAITLRSSAMAQAIYASIAPKKDCMRNHKRHVSTVCPQHVEKALSAVCSDQKR